MGRRPNLSIGFTTDSSSASDDLPGAGWHQHQRRGTSLSTSPSPWARPAPPTLPLQPLTGVVEPLRVHAGRGGGRGDRGRRLRSLRLGLAEPVLLPFSGLRDPSPSQRVEQTIYVWDTLTATGGRHVIRFGGDYRAYLTTTAGPIPTPAAPSSSRASTRPGSPTGSRCRAPASTSPTSCSAAATGHRPVRARDRDASARRRGTCSSRTTGALRSNLTLNLGLRYEYVAPFSEPTAAS